MVKRKIFFDLVAHMPKKEISIITGARQTGKSTLLRQLESLCNTEAMSVVFLNLEHKTILFELNENPLNLLKYVPDSEKRTVVLVDEIQYLDDPSNFLKLLYDEQAEKLKIIATGSSAFYLDQQFKDSMAGRKRIFQLLTCSFDEYLELSGKPHLLDAKKSLLKRPDAKSTQLDYLRVEWEQYMIYGGYPAVITEPDKKEKVSRLREIRDSFVKRDLQESGVSNEAAFYQLFRILATQSGNLVNVNEIASTLRIKNTTVESYLLVLQKCFHIALIRPFYRNVRKELVKMPKVFLLDTGMKNCLLDNFQPLSSRIDKGELWENSVFRWLVEKYDFDSIRFWRTSAGNEVDFVIPDSAEAIAIEVKFNDSQIKPAKYKIFRKAYPDIPFQFLWLHPFSEDFFRRME